MFKVLLLIIFAIVASGFGESISDTLILESELKEVYLKKYGLWIEEINNNSVKGTSLAWDALRAVCKERLEEIYTDAEMKELVGMLDDKKTKSIAIKSIIIPCEIEIDTYVYKHYLDIFIYNNIKLPHVYIWNNMSEHHKLVYTQGVFDGAKFALTGAKTVFYDKFKGYDDFPHKFRGYMYALGTEHDLASIVEGIDMEYSCSTNNYRDFLWLTYKSRDELRKIDGQGSNP